MIKANREDLAWPLARGRHVQIEKGSRLLRMWFLIYMDKTFVLTWRNHYVALWFYLVYHQFKHTLNLWGLSILVWSLKCGVYY